ncbi:hypothetical protein ACROYT_G043427 [Oculina patagonica]
MSRLNQVSFQTVTNRQMKQKMIQPYSFVLICLCITQQARSKHLKEWVTRSGIEGKENLIDGAVPLDQFDSNECSVKTVDGPSPGQCCKFPFLYFGEERTSCVPGLFTNRKWCAVTYNYDEEKQWGWCPDPPTPSPTPRDSSDCWDVLGDYYCGTVDLADGCPPLDDHQLVALWKGLCARTCGLCGLL